MSHAAKIIPPGEDPRDPYIKDLDAPAFALSRLGTHLRWIGEHHASFQELRTSDPKLADQELLYLTDSIRQAREHLERLTELVLAGYTIDPAKRLPPELSGGLTGQPGQDQQP